MNRIFRWFLFCLLLSAGVHLSAHHQLGLPHYMYSKDYPQIPTMVVEADAEGYTVTFSTFPGNPRPGETVRIKVYIKHTKTKKVYTAPIRLSISTLTFFGGENEMLAPRTVNCDYNEYKVSYVFQEAEKYLVNVVFEPRSDYREKIPFPIVIGRTNFNIIPIVFGAVLLLVFVVVGVVKRGKDKKGTNEIAQEESAEAAEEVGAESGKEGKEEDG
ncbi:MAG: hypothetical protein GY765_18890 [bacterium]|nr:hypothetical protein [bacterium]